MITSNGIADKFISNGIKTYFAKPEREDIVFEDGIDDLDKFISLILDLKVNVVFLYRSLLESENIEDNIITSEDYSQKYETLFKKEAKEYNKTLSNMKQHIGKEVFINVFFAYSGLVYSLLLFNDELMIEEKEDFLDGLKARYEEQIDRIDNDQFEQHSIVRKEYLKKLKDYLVKDDEFKKCTNKALRRSYAIVLMRGGEDGSIKEMIYPLQRLLTDREFVPVIEETWLQIKMNTKC